MTMIGSRFHFRCDNCDATSLDYYIYLFHDVILPEIRLPTWSLTYSCWGEIELSLSAEQRNQFELEPNELVKFAESLSSDHLTVCVPLLNQELDHNEISVSPSAVCPKCKRPCHCLRGSPTSSRKTFLKVDSIPRRDLESATLASIETSLRIKLVCHKLGIKTIGDLRERRDDFVNNVLTNEKMTSEVDGWLSR